MIGLGWDSHRLEPGRRLVLGGVEIPGELGLAGHSDADVLTHAIMDALLGAAGLGDIGERFPALPPPDVAAWLPERFETGSPGARTTGRWRG